MRRIRSLEERFWEKVDRINGQVHPIHGRCWQWIGAGSSSPDRYGSINRGGHGCHYGPMLRAHHVSLELAGIAIPDGLNVLHKCDNRLCVRPEHLFVGTEQDNVDDMMAKGRFRAPSSAAKGAHNGNAKLSEKDVIAVRGLYASGRATQRELASMYGVGETQISHIITRRRWSHVADQIGAE